MEARLEGWRELVRVPLPPFISFFFYLMLFVKSSGKKLMFLSIVAAAIASGHLGGSAAGESGATYSRLEAALAGGYAQMSTIQPGFGPAETSGFTRPSSRGRFQGAGTSRGGPGGATGSPSDTFGVQITARPLGTSGGTAAPLRAGGPPPSGTLSGRKSSGGSESSQGRGRRKKT